MPNMSGRKALVRPIEAEPEVEVVFDDLEPEASIGNDDEINQMLARLKSKFAPRSGAAYLSRADAGVVVVKEEPGLSIPSSPHEEPLLHLGSQEVVVTDDGSGSAPTLNSTISRLANYLSDKHGKDFSPVSAAIQKSAGKANNNNNNINNNNSGAATVTTLPAGAGYRTRFLIEQPSHQQLQHQSQHLHQQQHQQQQQQQQRVSVAVVRAKMLSLDREKRFSCYVCQRRFHLFAHLRNHLETHTGEKPHVCKQCGKCFSTPTSLKRHVPIHHSDKKHRCSVCGKTYANQGYLKVHMRIHRDEKPFECELCGRAFRQLAHLNHHLLTHTGDKPHKCDLCGQRFRQANTLEDHMRLHTGERPHVCHICGKSFTHRLSLKLHMKYHVVDIERKPEISAEEIEIIAV